MLKEQQKSNTPSADATVETRLYIRLAKQFWRLAFETMIPLALSLWVWLEAEEAFRFRQHGNLIFTVAFVMLVVGSSFFFSSILRQLQGWLQANRPDFPRGSVRLRPRVRFLVLHIGLPFLVSLSVALIPISGETFLSRALDYFKFRGEYKLLPEVKKAVLENPDLITKTNGITCLGEIRSPLALEYLFDILRQESDFLEEYKYYSSMSSAFQSFGAKSLPGLLQFFNEQDPHLRGEFRSAGVDLHSRYFESAIKALRRDLEERARFGDDLEEATIHLQTLELELKESLVDLSKKSPRLTGAATSLDFVLETVINLDEVRQNDEFYSLARRVASDPNYPEPTRSWAILLIGKLGKKADFEVLQSFIHSDVPAIRGSAMYSIGCLHRKLESGARPCQYWQPEASGG